MSSRLIRHLTKERVGAVADVLQDIVELLNKDLQASTNKMRKEQNFENPAWPYEQAAFLGEQRAYKKVIELLTIKQRGTNDG